MWHRYRLGTMNYMCSVHVDYVIKRMKYYCSLHNMSGSGFLNNIPNLSNTIAKRSLKEPEQTPEPAIDLYYNKHKWLLHSIFQIGNKPIPVSTTSFYSKYTESSKGRSFISPVIQYVEYGISTDPVVSDTDKCNHIQTLFDQTIYNHMIVVLKWKDTPLDYYYGFKNSSGIIVCDNEKDIVFEKYCKDKIQGIPSTKPLLTKLDNLIRSKDATDIMNYSLKNNIVSNFVEQYKLSTQRLDDEKYKYIKEIMNSIDRDKNTYVHDVNTKILEHIFRENESNTLSGIHTFLLQKVAVMNDIYEKINDTVVLSLGRSLLNEDKSTIEDIRDKFKRVFRCNGAADWGEDAPMFSKYCNNDESYDMASKFTNMFDLSTPNNIRLSVNALIQRFHKGPDIIDTRNRDAIREIVPSNIILVFEDDDYVQLTYATSIGDMKERIVSLANFLTCIDDFKQLSNKNYNLYLENSEYIQENERQIGHIYEILQRKHVAMTAFIRNLPVEERKLPKHLEPLYAIRDILNTSEKVFGSKYKFNLTHIEKTIADFDYIPEYKKATLAHSVEADDDEDYSGIDDEDYSDIDDEGDIDDEDDGDDFMEDDV